MFWSLRKAKGLKSFTHNLNNFNYTLLNLYFNIISFENGDFTLLFGSTLNPVT